MRTLFGVDVLIGSGGNREMCLGLVTNDAARTAGNADVLSRVALLEAGFNIVRLFSPEHGLAASAADGVAVADAVDRVTGLPVSSLYGEKMKPRVDSLMDLDAVLVDLPDVGSRFYTYIWTLSHVIDGCARAGVPIIVLDRPNPIGGNLDLCEGPLLDVNQCGSFLGRLPIPIRHGLSIGEFARLWRAERNPNADVEVVAMDNWQRARQWPDLGIPFVPMSPSMPSFNAALLYPGICLFEATNLSVGRGTATPFQVVGAPWLKPKDVLAALDRIPDAHFEPTEFTPTHEPWKGRLCSGIRIHAGDRERIRPVALGLRLLNAIVRCEQGLFEWAGYPTSANPSGADHFELLLGRADAGGIIKRGEMDDMGIEALTRVPGWKESVQGHLIYG